MGVDMATGGQVKSIEPSTIRAASEGSGTQEPRHTPGLLVSLSSNCVDPYYARTHANSTIVLHISVTYSDVPAPLL